jgi:hypothetical protein
MDFIITIKKIAFISLMFIPILINLLKNGIIVLPQIMDIEKLNQIMMDFIQLLFISPMELPKPFG